MTGALVTDPLQRFLPAPNQPIGSREQADAELGALSASIDAISSALLDLESHPGHQLLRSYPQSGQTDREWSTVRELLAGLWEDFARMRSVADSARAVRQRRGRPDAADLAELTYLLHGEPIELSSQAVPLSQRTLTGPAATSNRIGLAGLAARMNQIFERAGDLVTRVDSVATTVREGLTPIQARLAAARELASPSGTGAGPADPDLAALKSVDDKIIELTRRSVSDALSVTNPAGEITALAAELAGIENKIRQQDELRRSWPEKLAELRELAVQIAAAQQRGRRARDAVAQTIRTAPLPEPVDRLREVNGRLESLDSIAGWWARARAVDQARRMAEDALAAAIADEQLAGGLLQRRTELKGRLSAYRSKAIRLGRVADPDADAWYEQAAAALAAVPCDLAAATTAVAKYQDRVLGASDRTPGRSA